MTPEKYCRLILTRYSQNKKKEKKKKKVRKKKPKLDKIGIDFLFCMQKVANKQQRNQQNRLKKWQMLWHINGEGKVWQKNKLKCK